MEESPTAEECPTNEECAEKYNNDDKYRAKLLPGKYLKSLVTIPTDQIIQDQLNKTTERKPACSLFEGAIHHLLKIVENIFKCLRIYGIPVVLKTYPKESDLKVLNDALLAFYPSYYT